MKWFLAIIISLFFLSCQKENNLGEGYNKLIGTWGNINGDDSCTLKLSSDGVFEYHKSFTKNKNFKIKTFFKEDEIYLNYIIYKVDGRKDKYYICVAPTFDTLFVASSDNTQNFYFNYDIQSYLIKK